MIANFVRTILNFYDFFYQKKIINFLSKDSDIQSMIDVGAHHGETIKLFLKYFKLNVIYSFEPSKKNFKVLYNQLNFLKKKNKQTKIYIFNQGLGEKNYETILNNTLESSSSTINEINKESKYYKRKIKSLITTSDKYIENFEKIKVITLDNFFSNQKLKKIDLLKIDTEGYELNILKGIKNNTKNIKYIYFEHHYDNMIKKNYTFSDIKELLNNYNFAQVFKIKMPFRKTFEYIYKNKSF